MEPLKTLVKEHGTIIRFVNKIREKVETDLKPEEINPEWLLIIIDFFSTYADKIHHGKEEKILFERLKGKEIEKEHRVGIDELMKEHVEARNLVERLLREEKDLENGKNNREKIIEIIKQLLMIYPPHVSKENQEYFVPFMEYFSEKEKEEIREEFKKIDLRFRPEKYVDIANNL